jgi:hypothetical protein
MKITSGIFTGGNIEGTNAQHKLEKKLHKANSTVERSIAHGNLANHHGHLSNYHLGMSKIKGGELSKLHKDMSDMHNKMQNYHNEQVDRLHQFLPPKVQNFLKGK